MSRNIHDPFFLFFHFSYFRKYAENLGWSDSRLSCTQPTHKRNSHSGSYRFTDERVGGGDLSHQLIGDIAQGPLLGCQQLLRGFLRGNLTGTHGQHALQVGLGQVDGPAGHLPHGQLQSVKDRQVTELVRACVCALCVSGAVNMQGFVWKRSCTICKFSFTDTTHSVQVTCSVEWLLAQVDTCTIDIGCENARWSFLKGWEWVIINQTNTETISKATLGKLKTFERRGGAHMGFSKCINTLLNWTVNTGGYGQLNMWEIKHRSLFHHTAAPSCGVGCISNYCQHTASTNRLRENMNTKGTERKHEHQGDCTDLTG